jgi:hypothetical protein
LQSLILDFCFRDVAFQCGPCKLHQCSTNRQRRRVLHHHHAFCLALYRALCRAFCLANRFVRKFRKQKKSRKNIKNIGKCIKKMENGFGLGGFGSGIWVLGFGTHFLVFTKFFKTFPNFLLIIFNPFSNFHFFVFVPTFPSPLRKDPQLQPRPPQPQKESVKVQRLCIIGCMDTFAQYFLASYFLF